MKTLDLSSEKIFPDNGVGKKAIGERYWQTAGDRVLLYLRCLGFPAPKALELSLAALKTAERNATRGSGGSPVVEAMEALHQLLREQEFGTLDTNLSVGAGRECVPPALPPLHRLSMVPERI